MSRKYVQSVGLIEIADALGEKHKISQKAAGEFILQFIEIILRHVKAGNEAEVFGLGVFFPRMQGGAVKLGAMRGRTIGFRPTEKLRRFFFEDA